MMTQPTQWKRDAYHGSAEDLAARLLGHRLVRILDDGTRLSGLIVETEAYIGVHDLASHAAGGRRTPRNESMYAEAGTAYVYTAYGIHSCFNVVCGERDEPVAVLVRALEPDEGVERMHAVGGFPEERAIHRLCAGPGLLCRALDIDRRHDGLDLTRSDRLFIERVRGGAQSGIRLARSPRIGIGGDHEWVRTPLRWFVEGNGSVSRGAQVRPKSGKGVIAGASAVAGGG